jgi:hypothetical protein
MTDQQYLTAHHEAGHAVATLLRGGGELLWITIEPTSKYLGYTGHRTKAVAVGDRMFITFAGPWAEARAGWPQPSIDGEDDDGCIFDDHLFAAWAHNRDGDFDAYEQMRVDDLGMLTLAAEHCGITPGELREQQGGLWRDELERAWGVIQQVAKLLLTGATVTDAVVRELVDAMWEVK